MAGGHHDVNLPPATWHRASSFLTEFGEWLQELGFNTWTIDKEPGNHLTNFWLHTRMDSSAPTKSQVQFGCTKFGKVNPRIHAYCRGKAPHLSAAVKLLRYYVEQVWSFGVSEEQTLSVEPSLAPQHQAWDQWDVVEMRQFRCPSTERLWYSTDDASSWFMPDADGTRSVCGNWLALPDEACVWWANESTRQLFVTVA